MSLWLSLTLAAIGNPVSNRAWAIFLGCFLALVGLGLLILSWTRWGQSKLLSKCIAIAMLAHIWLLLYAYGTRIPYGAPGQGQGGQGQGDQAPLVSALPTGPVMVAWTPMDSVPDPPSLQGNDGAGGESNAVSSPMETPLWNRSVELPLDSMADLKLLDSQFDEPISDDELRTLAEIDRDVIDGEVKADLPVDSSLVNSPSEPTNSLPIVPIEAPAAKPVRSLAEVPAAYRLRFSQDRLSTVLSNGGDANTEEAVRKALAFLAKSQSSDGSWSAQAHGAGQAHAQRASDAVYRADTGKFADTAMTGLALLAFLGAGHTHIDPGPYAENITKGIAYLCDQQFPSGDLSGRGQIGSQPTVRYSRMYSHGIAGIALAEAYAMTQDQSLIDPIRRATSYSIKAMNPKTGGWRYDFVSDDPGDTSQFGWQAMLLNSASASHASPLGGPHRVLLQRFLDSVSTGTAGGLAVYRNLNPLSRPPIEQATVAMTAEALALRSMLGLPMSAQASLEAKQLLLKNLPGKTEPNFYYWYYATLALHQTNTRQDAWVIWNDAMKTELLSTQISQGDLSGSWDPRCVWGGHGGRIYTTALACMCLEVYYRYLPIYQQETPLR